MKKKTILHGEAMITECQIPSGAKEIAVTGAHLVIAPSEVTGNDHVVENVEGCTFYELDGIRYMRNEEPTNVKCVHANRHNAISIPVGTYEFGVQQEYDYFSQSHQAVRD